LSYAGSNLPAVLESQVLLDGPVLTVARVCCPGQGRRFGPAELVTDAAIVLPRRGVFRLRTDGRDRVVDPAMAYLQWPGEEQQFAHPAGGDVCTSIRLGRKPTTELAEEGLPAMASGPVPVAPPLAVTHRLLLSRARAGADGVELADLAGALVAEVLAAMGAPPGGDPAPAGPSAPAAAIRQRRLVEDARELLSCEPDRALPDLAALLGSSPWRLSRLFHRITGVTLHHYRTRLRVSAALDRLAGGADSLAGLAAELGFSDQAHLSRVVRQSTGLTPGRLRTLIGPDAQPG
jgi:AraC-like DNA-binding protein